MSTTVADKATEVVVSTEEEAKSLDWNKIGKVAFWMLLAGGVVYAIYYFSQKK